MNEIWFQRIDDYLSARMTPEERLQFETAMAEDKELPALLNIYKAIETEMRNISAGSEARTALEQSLHNISATYANGKRTQTENTQSEEPGVSGVKQKPATADETARPLMADPEGSKKIYRIRMMAAAAAAIATIIIISVLWMFYGKTNNRQVAGNNRKAGTSTHLPADTVKEKSIVPEIAKADTQRGIPKINKPTLNTAKRQQLFAANFTPDDLPDNIPEVLAEPMEDYKAARHAQALKGFEAAGIDINARGMQEDNKLSGFYIQYYKGQCYLATNNAPKAIVALQHALVQSPGKNLNVKVSWYLALAYLKAGDTNKAGKLLHSVAASRATPYTQQAGRLLGAITGASN